MKGKRWQSMAAAIPDWMQTAFEGCFHWDFARHDMESENVQALIAHRGCGRDCLALHSSTGAAGGSGAAA